MKKVLIKNKKEKQEKLKEYKKVELELELLKAQKERIRENKREIKQSIGGIHSTGKRDTIDYIIELEEVEGRIKEKILQCTRKMETYEKAINKLSNISEKNILRLRYIEGKNIKDIEKKMFITRTALYNLENKALDNIKLYKKVNTNEHENVVI